MLQKLILFLALLAGCDFGLSAAQSVPVNYRGGMYCYPSGWSPDIMYCRSESDGNWPGDLWRCSIRAGAWDCTQVRS